MGTDFQISVANMKVCIILGILTLATAAPPIQPRAQTRAKVPSWMKSAFTSFDRIVGGANAGSAIPWQVSLRNSASGSTHFCGGTILDANTVLSAAHCFHNGHQGVVVVAGSHKRSDSTGVQTSTISKSIYNQDAKYNKANMDNDIIILKLTTALKFNKNVQPACLPEKSFDAPEKSKSMAVVSGWGTTKSGGSLPDILQYVNLPLNLQWFVLDTKKEKKIPVKETQEVHWLSLKAKVMILLSFMELSAGELGVPRLIYQEFMPELLNSLIGLRRI